MHSRWSGYYINLDRSHDRRRRIETELRTAGIRPWYTRFSAVDGREFAAENSHLRPGEIGCFRSHAQIIQQLRGEQWVHILEDDAILCELFPNIVEGLITSQAFQTFDLVFSDIIIAAPHVATLKNLKASYDKAMANRPHIQVGVMNLRDSNFAGANSYFVNPGSLSTLRELLDAELLCTGGLTLPIDLFYRRAVQQGRLRAACVFPFISRVPIESSSNTSTVGGGQVSALQALASDLLRTVFSVDWDPKLVDAGLAVLRARKPDDEHLTLLAEIVRVMIGD